VVIRAFYPASSSV